MSELRMNVPIEEAGEGAIVDFAFDVALELSDEHDGLANVVAKLDGLDLKCIRRCAEVAIHGGDAERALRTMPIEALSGRLLDALLLRIRGKTVAEIEGADA